MAEVRLHHVDGLKFDVETGTGNRLRIDVREAAGGENSGPGPMELQLVALGGCGAMDVISILRKMREDVTDYEVSVTGERAAEHPRVYTSIAMHHRIRGRDLSEAKIRRAIFLSITRYCPVLAMISPAVPVAVRYEILDEEGVLVRSGYVQSDVPEPATQR